ncbi:ADP-ribosylation factor family-domain-containing protein [Mycena filopes]|nr:ADP-ribosylation factor family-domain-containing protein [Mycena filopes]
MGSGISTATATAADRIAGTALPKSFTIVMVGLDGAGKTSLLNRFKRRELPSGILPATTTTIGPTIETIPYGRHRATIWELGGQERIRPLWRRFFRNGVAYIFVVDATAPERFPDVKAELHFMWGNAGKKYYPVLILANKMDLEGAVSLDAIAEAVDFEKLVKSRTAAALKGISAMTGEGTDEVFKFFVQNVSHKLIAEHNEAMKHATSCC